MASLYNKLHGRDVAKNPECPFCGRIIAKPEYLPARMYGEMPVGICACGAAYAYDETGHNLGNALSEALVLSCNMDWDLAWDLSSEEDYKEAIIEHYDGTDHLVYPGGFCNGRQIPGALYFIRLNDEIAEATVPAARKRLKRKIEAEPEKTVKDVTCRRLTKKEIEALVRDYNSAPLLARASQDKSLIRNIQRLLYTGDDQMRKRAADILGQVCAVIADYDPGIVSRLLHNLFYSITDTAAFPWGAFEAISEIIAHKPDIFGPYLAELYQFLPDETRRSQAMEAIARIAGAKPALVRKHTFYFLPFLNDPDPKVRGYTVLLMENLDAREMKKDIERLVDDDHEITIYRDGMLDSITVGALAMSALERL